jgi:quinol-cytochrome oxidoreductase complex cytochrome b subunit
MGSILDWLDTRFALKRSHGRFLQRRIPSDLGYTYCFGGIAFTCFLMLASSGLLLSLYYVPSEKDAYHSIVLITNEVTLGWIVRGIHKWSASLFIISIMFHTIRVFVSKAYRPPRDLNWMVGVMTLVLAMFSGFTGYLLPWDQKAYWATEVGTAMAQNVPLLGGYIMHAFRGGPEVSGSTLVRFYSLHILYLPLSMAILQWAHFHMVKRLGISRNL